MEKPIRKAITEALVHIGGREIPFSLEKPPNSVHGDYTTNAAMVAAKQLGRNPLDLANELAQALTKVLSKKVERVIVAGPGFMNITLARATIASVIAKAAAQGTEWGKGNSKEGLRSIVEYGNPNPFKEMHIGHAMGAIIGEALSRLVENEGAKVARDTFGGDVGPHVAKTIWALQRKGVAEPESAGEIGEAYTEGARAYEDDAAAKTDIDALNKELYAGTDRALMGLWRKGRDVSMEEFKRLWRILGTRFDFTFFDSDTVEGGMRTVRDGLAKGIFKMSDGAVVYDGTAKGVHTMVFITSHETPTYEAKDIGLAFLKEERWPNDQVIIVTSNEQTGRFKTVLAALEDIAPSIAAKTTHVAHGVLKLASGKMSSRKGNVITAAEFIRDIVKKAGERNADPLIAEQVAVGAIKYMVLRQTPGSDIIFDAEKSLSLEGDSGPYLQYALVRARSVLAQAVGEIKETMPTKPYFLERLILHFPEVVARTTHELAPNLLVNYLTEAAGAWNSFYAKERIIGGDHEAYKRTLARAFAETMTKGLTLLGIPVPERM